MKLVTQYLLLIQVVRVIYRMTPGLVMEATAITVITYISSPNTTLFQNIRVFD